MYFSPKDITSPDGYFEDFNIGRVIRHHRGKTVTEMDNVLLTNLVMNTAEGHFNEDFMKTAFKGVAGFDTRVVYGGINFSLVVGLAAQDTAEHAIEELGMDKIRLRAPVHHGDTLYAYSEVLETRDADRSDAGVVVFKHYGVNQDEKLVFEGERSVLIRKRSA